MFYIKDMVFIFLIFGSGSHNFNYMFEIHLSKLYFDGYSNPNLFFNACAFY